jgi:hypothetical protein
MRILLLLIFPLLVLARIVNFVCGSDRLRLRARNQASFWIERRRQAGMASYFLESPPAEGGGQWSAVRPLTRLLRGLARLYAVRRSPHDRSAPGAARHGDQNIPDEVYTLW